MKWKLPLRPLLKHLMLMGETPPSADEANLLLLDVAAVIAQCLPYATAEWSNRAGRSARPLVRAARTDTAPAVDCQPNSARAARADDARVAAFASVGGCCESWSGMAAPT